MLQYAWYRLRITVDCYPPSPKNAIRLPFRDVVHTNTYLCVLCVRHKFMFNIFRCVYWCAECVKWKERTKRCCRLPTTTSQKKRKKQIAIQSMAHTWEENEISAEKRNFPSIRHSTNLTWGPQTLDLQCITCRCQCTNVAVHACRVVAYLNMIYRHVASYFVGLRNMGGERQTQHSRYSLYV